MTVWELGPWELGVGSLGVDMGMRADGQPLTVIVQLLTQVTGRIVPYVDTAAFMGTHDRLPTSGVPTAS